MSDLTGYQLGTYIGGGFNNTLKENGVIPEKKLINANSCVPLNTEHPSGRDLYNVFVEGYKKLEKSRDIFDAVQMYYTNVNPLSSDYIVK